MSQNKKNLSFEDLKLEQIVFEVRFPVAFLLSGQGGRLWQDIENSLPNKNLIIKEFEAAKIASVYDDRFEITIEIERLAVSCFYPKQSLTDFLDVLKIIYNLAVERLELQTFNRVGLRQIFVKECNSLKQVTETLLTLNFIKLPEDITSTYSNHTFIPSFSMRVEDEQKGKVFNFRGQSRSFNVELPITFVEDDKPKNSVLSQYLVAFDVDTYTKINVDVGQLSIVDWIEQANYSVKKDGSMFFEVK